MKIGETISRKLMRESPSHEKTSQRFPGIAFTAFVTPCSIESREGASDWFIGSLGRSLGFERFFL